MGWLTGWTYRKKIVLNASADGALANYQLPVRVYRTTGTDGTESMGAFTAGKVYVSTKCAADYDDIRFTTDDGETLLDYWIEESDSDDATIWVEFDSIADSGTTEFYIYYDGTETAVSSGDNTFSFFDHFDSDMSKWTTSGSGTIDLASSIATFNTNANNATSYSNTALPSATFAIRSYAKVNNGGGGGTGAAYFNIGIDDGSWAVYENMADWLCDDYSPNNNVIISCNTGRQYPSNAASNITLNAYKTVDFIVRANTNARLFENNTEKTGSPKTTNPCNVSGLKGYLKSYSNIGAATNIVIDWYLYKNYTYNEPTWGSWGSEETEPAASSAPMSNAIPAMMALLMN